MKKLSVTIPEAMSMTGLGRSTIYRLFDEKKLIRRKCGNRTLILVSELEEFVRTLPLDNEEVA